MESTPLPRAELSGAVPMYSKPEPLSPQAHGDLSLTGSDAPFAFAFGLNACPLQVSEFAPAALTYPVIFAGDDKAPLAVMSIRPNENLFITEGTFDPAAYIPAFIRRYPFVVATNAENNQAIVCIDTDAHFLTKGAGDVKLFENGEPTEYTRNAIKFCEDFEQESGRTRSFMDLLKQHDLFEHRRHTIRPPNPDGSEGEEVQLAEYYAVSEDKVKALPATVLHELYANGALQQIVAHTLSLQNWDRLVQRTITRMPQEVIANA